MTSAITAPTLADELARGYTLPASWYTDPAVLQLERERIFARSWQFVGRTAQVAEPGDFFSCYAGHIPIAVVRDQDGDLRGFVNVCRHRGHEVVRGEGNRQALQCPYHAWTYGLDGCLRNAPRADHEPDFPTDELSLLPVKVDTWGPFVFVNPDPGAQSLDDVLSDVPGIVEESGVGLGRLEYHGRREWTLNANWKVGIENYLECYHCPVAHPGFSAMIDVAEDSYGTRRQRGLRASGLLSAPSALAGNGKRKKVAYDAHGEVAEAQYHLVWPNLTINIDPGRANCRSTSGSPTAPSGRSASAISSSRRTFPTTSARR